MIKKISVTNFKSIKQKVTLDLEASPDRSLKSNFFSTEKILKSAVIYGHNASGKSNFLEAIDFFIHLIITSHKNNEGDKIRNRNFYKLDDEYSKKSSEFEIEFELNSMNFVYFFSCDDKEISEEKLTKNNKVLFHRKEKSLVEVNNYDKNKLNNYFDSTLDNMLLLSRAVNLKEDKILKEIYLFMRNISVITQSNMFLEDFDSEITAEFIYNNPHSKNEVIELLEACDLEIVDIKVVERDEEEYEKYPSKIKRLLSSPLEVKFIHRKSSSDELIEFDLDEESQGTKRFFSMIGLILSNIENNKVLFIDELEKNLHPMLMEYLVKLFNSDKNKKSQFIFTTHNTELLNLNLLRRDQINFMQKNPDESTFLNSLYDFKVRKDLDIKKAYFSGRFGGIPIIIED